MLLGDPGGEATHMSLHTLHDAGLIGEQWDLPEAPEATLPSQREPVTEWNHSPQSQVHSLTISTSSSCTLTRILFPSRGRRVAQLPLSRLQILPREVSLRIKPVSPLFRDPQQVRHQTGVPPGQNTPRYAHLSNGSSSVV